MSLKAAGGDTAGYIDNIIGTLQEKIGDSNNKMKETATNSLISLGQFPVLGNPAIVTAISKG